MYENYNNEDRYERPASNPLTYTEMPKKKKKHKAAKIIALALCCSLLGGIVGAGGVVLGTRLMAKSRNSAENHSSVVMEGEREPVVIDIAKIDTSKKMTAAEVYAANVSSTVGITTSITTNYWGYQTTSAASGSGFILTSDGYILTNYHVIENSDSITVSMYDGKSYEAKLIGCDESNDIAVLKIEAEDLVPVVLGDSDDLNIGEDVIAIGNPLGELTFSLTSGVVSALNREVTLSSSVTMDLIQTDCAINSGNSGGALFNLYGEVVGITNAKYSSSGLSSSASIDNIGFAIPINSIRSIVESIIEKGYISKPYIGVSVTDVSEETQSYGLPKGAAVKGVNEDGPAEKAGIKENDIITEIDGKAISGSGELIDIIKESKIGQSITLTIYRQGQTLTVTLEVGEQIQSSIQEEKEETEEKENNDQGQQFGGGFFPWGFFDF